MTGYNNCNLFAEEERDAAQSRLYASQKPTAESIYYYKCLDAMNEEKMEKARRDQKVAIAKAPAKKKPAKKSNPNPQPKVKKYFNDKENEDGYPMKFCTFEPKEARFVYRPPGYPKPEHQYKAEHCCSCHLKPCITEVHGLDAQDHMNELHLEKKKTLLASEEAGIVLLHKLYCKLIKRRYLKKLQAPQCIMERVKVYTDVLEDMEEDSTTPTDEDSGSSGEEEATFERSRCWHERKAPTWFDKIKTAMQVHEEQRKRADSDSDSEYEF